MKHIDVADVPLPRHRRPFTPGEMLNEEFLTPLGLTQQDLADAIVMDRPSVNALLNGWRELTSRTALRRDRALGVSAQFWLNLQQDLDLWEATRDRDLTRDLSIFRYCTRGCPRIGLRTRGFGIDTGAASLRNVTVPGNRAETRLYDCLGLHDGFVVTGDSDGAGRGLVQLIE